MTCDFLMCKLYSLHSTRPVLMMSPSLFVVAGTNPTLSSGAGVAAVPAPQLPGGSPLQLNRQLHPLIDLTTLEASKLHYDFITKMKNPNLQSNIFTRFRREETTRLRSSAC